MRVAAFSSICAISLGEVVKSKCGILIPRDSVQIRVIVNNDRVDMCADTIFVVFLPSFSYFSTSSELLLLPARFPQIVRSLPSTSVICDSAHCAALSFHNDVPQPLKISAPFLIGRTEPNCLQLPRPHRTSWSFASLAAPR